VIVIECSDYLSVSTLRILAALQKRRGNANAVRGQFENY